MTRELRTGRNICPECGLHAVDHGKERGCWNLACQRPAHWVYQQSRKVAVSVPPEAASEGEYTCGIHGPLTPNERKLGCCSAAIWNPPTRKPAASQGEAERGCSSREAVQSALMDAIEAGLKGVSTQLESGLPMEAVVIDYAKIVRGLTKKLYARSAVEGTPSVGAEDIAIVRRELDAMAHTNAYGPLRAALERLLEGAQARQEQGNG